MHSLLRGHADKVTAVKFAKSPTNQESLILSGSVDKTLRVWKVSKDLSNGFEEIAVSHSHAGTINCLAVAPELCIFASGAADASIKIWGFSIDEGIIHLNLQQTIQTHPRFFVLALALHQIKETEDVLLAAAGTTRSVQVFIADKSDGFCHQATLAGHEGWVRSLAITKEHNKADSDLLLASASQDKYIRLWRIQRGKEPPQCLDSGQRQPKSGEYLLSNKAHQLATSRSFYTLTFEALLLGHEDWIYTLQWYASSQRLQLLSASADSSLAFWESEAISGVWVCTRRLGEIDTQKGATTATGSAGGFWIGLWSPSGENVVSLGRTGSWRLWNHIKDENRWIQDIGTSGHTKSVSDIAWAKDGSYLLSTGSDQTTRLYAEWKHEPGNSWHELARPQIHGYDLNCIDSIGQNQIISGADEKLLRVFDKPRAAADLLFTLCGIHTAAGETMPDVANIPVLGLSNKAVEHDDEKTTEDSPNDQIPGGSISARSAVTTSMKHPPFEDQLARHTLWPETEKLYGHGFEISSVASSHDGSLVATSCKATSVAHAVIRLYDTKDWREIKPSLEAHSLTVTCLRFSADDQYLLSVGRDRQWVVFQRDSHKPYSYKLKQSNPKGHSRMILSASWAPLEAGRIFATASRDKTVKIWKMQAEVTECHTTLMASSPVTAVDIFSRCIEENMIVAIGTESSDIVLYILGTSTFIVHKLNMQ